VCPLDPLMIFCPFKSNVCCLQTTLYITGCLTLSCADRPLGYWLQCNTRYIMHNKGKSVGVGSHPYIPTNFIIFEHECRSDIIFKYKFPNTEQALNSFSNRGKMEGLSTVACFPVYSVS